MSILDLQGLEATAERAAEAGMAISCCGSCHCLTNEGGAE